MPTKEQLHAMTLVEQVKVAKMAIDSKNKELILSIVSNMEKLILADINSEPSKNPAENSLKEVFATATNDVEFNSTLCILLDIMHHKCSNFELFFILEEYTRKFRNLHYFADEARHMAPPDMQFMHSAFKLAGRSYGISKATQEPFGKHRDLRSIDRLLRPRLILLMIDKYWHRDQFGDLKVSYMRAGKPEHREADAFYKKDYKVRFEDGLLKRDVDAGSNMQDGEYLYIISPKGRMYSVKVNEIPGLRHSASRAGQPVLCAGYISVRDGKIESIDNNSGHYLPPNESVISLAIDMYEKGIIDSSCIIRFYDRKAETIKDGNGEPIHEINIFDLITREDLQFENPELEEFRANMRNLQTMKPIR